MGATVASSPYTGKRFRFRFFNREHTELCQGICERDGRTHLLFFAHDGAAHRTYEIAAVRCTEDVWDDALGESPSAAVQISTLQRAGFHAVDDDEPALVTEAFALSQSLFLSWDGRSFEDRTYRVFSKAARRALRRQEASHG